MNAALPLFCRLSQQGAETKALAQGLDALHAEGTRLSGLLAEAKAQQGKAAEETALLEANIAADLKVFCEGRD